MYVQIILYNLFFYSPVVLHSQNLFTTLFALRNRSTKASSKFVAGNFARFLKKIVLLFYAKKKKPAEMFIPFVAFTKERIKKGGSNFHPLTLLCVGVVKMRGLETKKKVNLVSVTCDFSELCFLCPCDRSPSLSSLFLLFFSRENFLIEGLQQEEKVWAGDIEFGFLTF